jgi:acyl transferase domain-containing protein/3-hydroxymyristoyl/3-hydroxydecanoyl-(acyl carrier protein) dehydratase
MDPIAVIGIANLFPGAKDSRQFWNNLIEKRDTRGTATYEQMGVDPQKYFGKKGDTDKFYCMRGGYITDFTFDTSGFALDAAFLNDLDVIYQWALHAAREALRDAGALNSPLLARCGLVLGNLSFPTRKSNHLFMSLYHKTVERALQQKLGNSNFTLDNFTEARDVDPHNGLIAGLPAALVAQALGLGGSHFAQDSACASSCYSVKLASDYLNTGKADLMLAGAVSAADPMFVNMGFSIFEAYPGNNISAPLDKNSQGLYAGEGAGVLVLKRHADAVRDGDRIHAIVRGGGLSNDGKGVFVLAPNTKGQVLAYERAYADAGVDPASVQFVECHATGTPKGDKVELGSMETFFGKHKSKPLIGSVKSNVGHLLTAAGMPGMSKAIRALNEGVIPAQINMQQSLQSTTGYFGSAQIPVETTAWPATTTGNPRRAGVSVFGFGGANAHLVIEQPSANFSAPKSPVKAAQPMAIVGMDALFGDCVGIEQFVDTVKNSRRHFRALPAKRWKGIERETALLKQLDFAAPQGAYIEAFEMDFLRFKIPPNEKDCLIPQQLLMMKVADNAAHQAGLAQGSNVAVLVAMGVELELHSYRGRVNLATQIESALARSGVKLSDAQREELTTIAKDSVASAAQLNQYTSFIGNIMASRISSLWDFSGPAFTISAEENSVFRCLELADNLFRTSDVEAVIIAAVDLAGSAENVFLRSRFAPISVDGSGNGINVGEGAGSVVLKREADATRAGNTIFATVAGLGCANGVDAGNVTHAILGALEAAKLNAADVHYVEANRSGVAAHDATEQQVLQAQFAKATAGTIKASVGHTFAASGMASLLKAAVLGSASGKPCNVLVNSLGLDGTSTAVAVASRTQSVKAVAAGAGAKQLIRKIHMGGVPIAESLAGAKVSAELQAVLPQLKSATFAPSKNPLFLPTRKAKANAIAAVSAASIVAPAAPVSNSPRRHSEKVSAMTKQQNAPLTASATGEGLAAYLEDSPQFAAYQQNMSQVSRAHAAFLDQRQDAIKKMGDLISLQTQIAAGGNTVSLQTLPVIPHAAASAVAITPALAPVPTVVSAPKQKLPVLRERFSKPKQVIFDQAAMVEFAEGKIGNVFGPEYSVIDNYPRRVRLPTTDYLLVTRCTDLEAKTNEYKPCYMATEYDIPVDAPYLIDGQIPWSVSVESGQCDLMLISYLGIDFQNKGVRVYRLLDCTLTFLEDMAFGGQTLRYEIHIDSFAKNGDQLLFFFHYDCFVDGRKVLIMRGGCAGFFTDEELAVGKGVVHTDTDRAEIANAKKKYFQPLINGVNRIYEYNDMLKLINGDIAGCFGPQYDQGGLNPSLKFSSQKFLMIERVTRIDPTGGPWGLGVLEGEKRLEPEHWYFPCHFKDDQVMAGSLMSEGCGQLAMFYMLFTGMQTRVKNARFQPVPGMSQKVRCRGQVTPQSNTLTYRMTITDMGIEPYPFLKANIDIILDGKVVVDFKNLSVMIKEQEDNSDYTVPLPAHLKNYQVPALPAGYGSASAPAATSAPAAADGERDSTGKIPFANPNAPLMWVESNLDVAKIKGVTPIKHRAAPFVEGQNRVANTTPFTPYHMFEFATGDISKCFGPEFDVYKGRIPPRTPCGDLQLSTRVVETKGERLDLKKVSSCVAEYEVPRDAWYFTKNSHDAWMPYSIIMEIALQPNGFISGWMGTTLKYPDKDLFFRNLDGTGNLLRRVDLRGKTIVNQSVMLSTSMAGGAIIQSFTFKLLTDGEPFYEGTAVFGYFSADALTNQLGIDNGRITNAWHVDNNRQAERIDLRDASHAFFKAPAGKPHYRLPGGQLHFIDTVDVVEGGGKAGKGYVYAERTIDATDWFFRYHFHQDPVMPGSLGVEAIIETMQTWALKNNLGANFKNPRFAQPLSKVVWKYRGQITPINKKMNLDVHITDVRHEDGRVVVVGDANLSKDGLRIYEVKDIVVCIEEA